MALLLWVLHRKEGKRTGQLLPLGMQPHVTHAASWQGSVLLSAFVAMGEVASFCSPIHPQMVRWGEAVGSACLLSGSASLCFPAASPGPFHLALLE